MLTQTCGQQQHLLSPGKVAAVQCAARKVEGHLQKAQESTRQYMRGYWRGPVCSIFSKQIHPFLCESCVMKFIVLLHLQVYASKP